MAYTLQAIVAKNGVVAREPVEGSHWVPLKQGYEMLPFTDAFIQKHQLPYLPLTGEGREALPEKISSLCSILSAGRPLAYIEAEFFAGDGTQAFAVFENGELTQGPKVDESAINEALSILGAQKGRCRDEFEAMGLQQHRATEEWLKTGPR